MPTRDRSAGVAGSGHGGAWLNDLVREKFGTLSPAERQVAEYLVRQPERVVFMSAAQLAEATGTSDATVIRTARSLGFAGLPELKHGIGESLLNVVSPGERVTHRLQGQDGSGARVLDTVFTEVRERVDEQQRRLDPAELTAAADAIATGPRTWTFGVGVSAVAALYLATKLNRAGVRAFSARTMGFALADDIIGLEPGDTAVLFSPSRAFREVEVVLDTVRELGGVSVLVADSLTAQGESRPDVVLAAPLSMTGTTGEVFSELVICDALVLAVAQRASDAAAATSERLNAVRRQLLAPVHPRSRRREPDTPTS
ncbi:MurR/RpiR family transcriptional regulator [Cryptosporangium aurantiacum]|uniref:Transcriptional regulator, RpiR family n=1 Tax=Cryptosporangium aurantiacum TaxID=134849 RepID=A0A1M7RJ18_9ACTN|nr:MurR/RpiR family transcriptional regulator [Cryptosporangium aurantiacum]SHN46325.1 transcriptional regulator, RpiR family [Cryptosporangium aurantiacum]